MTVFFFIWRATTILDSNLYCFKYRILPSFFITSFAIIHCTFHYFEYCILPFLLILGYAI